MVNTHYSIQATHYRNVHLKPIISLTNVTPINSIKINSIKIKNLKNEYLKASINLGVFLSQLYIRGIDYMQEVNEKQKIILRF